MSESSSDCFVADSEDERYAKSSAGIFISFLFWSFWLIILLLTSDYYLVIVSAPPAPPMVPEVDQQSKYYKKVIRSIDFLRKLHYSLFHSWIRMRNTKAQQYKVISLALAMKNKTKNKTWKELRSYLKTHPEVKVAVDGLAAHDLPGDYTTPELTEADEE